MTGRGGSWLLLPRDMPDDGESDYYPVVRLHSAPLVFPSAKRLADVGWAVGVFELADRSGRVQSSSAWRADPKSRVRLPAMLPAGWTSAQMVSRLLGVAAEDAGTWILRNKLRRGLFLLRTSFALVSKVWLECVASYRCGLFAVPSGSWRSLLLSSWSRSIRCFAVSSC